MSSSYDSRLNKERAQIFKILGHPLRLAILDELRNGECCVQDLESRLGAEQSNISRHLSLLKQVGIIDCRKEGLFVYYFMAIPCIGNFFNCVNQVIMKRAENSRELCDKE
ncbi:ArsR family transcriptional regulator [Hydrogenispora ethanolica]|jgi:ArsR family transcriptional regulator|uniref:ArsR family transcriptional regulator n=1 Tax=Hydrogenispora ethanolica TaxID=1082276 RepID=A0A4R1R2W1_HYDET|nr:metalloregulator ArsR/SmtB family transcription factor [Hydrogenispora ethanolica]TCL59744.1 ArsR family transcriptional regulator [Hydrogenispora ethanolica]